MKIYLDANLLIFAYFDKGQKGEKAAEILKNIITGENAAVTSTLSLDETMWVLHRNNAKKEIREFIEDVYRMPNLEITSGSKLVPLRAVEYIEKYELRPRDAYHAAIMEEENIDTIASDDADFDRVKGITRIF